MKASHKAFRHQWANLLPWEVDDRYNQFTHKLLWFVEMRYLSAGLFDADLLSEINMQDVCRLPCLRKRRGMHYPTDAKFDFYKVLPRNRLQRDVSRRLMPTLCCEQRRFALTIDFSIEFAIGEINLLNILLEMSNKSMRSITASSPHIKLTFDMSGGRKWAKLACGRPLDGKVGRHRGERARLLGMLDGASQAPNTASASFSLVPCACSRTSGGTHCGNGTS